MMFAIGIIIGFTVRQFSYLLREKMRLHALHRMQPPVRHDPDQLTLL